jgi:aspartate kinase
MAVTVCKFGGTSLATRAQIEKCLEIMLADSSRKYLVVSAPGARFKGDIKITDLLIRAAEEYRASGKSPSADQVIARFREIIPEDPALVNQLQEDLQARLARTDAANYAEALKAYGEYASAVAVTGILKGQGINAGFIGPRDFGFRITGSGFNAKPDPKCYNKMTKLLAKQKSLALAVIPGFYGYDAAGELITLPRGGSDTSGAVVARAAQANIYENWTDENGLRRADPRVVINAATIPEMTFDEARELAYMGFKLQDACFEPIKGQGVALLVKNTNNPSHPGTRIADTREADAEERIVGIACEENFVSVGMRKMYIDKEVGFGRKMFSVLEKLDLPYEHTLDGVDSASLVLARKYLKGDKTLESVVKKLKHACQPEEMMIRDMALVSVAGMGMKNHFDVHARTFSALAREKITIRMIDEGADDLSFFIGVDNTRAADAVRAIYGEFYPG